MAKKSVLSIEAMFAQVEDLLKKLDSGELSLEESLTYYEQAHHTLAECAQTLRNVEEKIAVFDEKLNALQVLDHDQLRS